MRVGELGRHFKFRLVPSKFPSRSKLPAFRSGGVVLSVVPHIGAHSVVIAHGSEMQDT